MKPRWHCGRCDTTLERATTRYLTRAILEHRRDCHDTDDQPRAGVLEDTDRTR